MTFFLWLTVAALGLGAIAVAIIFHSGAVDETKANAALKDAEQSAAGGLSRLWARIRHK